jgi:Sulfotransferase family
MAEPSAQAAADERPQQGRQPSTTRVIYVMGAGHSGSTILGVALGNCEGVFYAGEVEEWLVNAGESPIGGTERTEFWRHVAEAVADADELFGVEANRCIERSSSVFRVSRWATRRRLRAPYRRVAQELLGAIARASGASAVVDTSHFPLRARELKALAEVEVFLVYLARDPQGVVSSELRAIHRHNVAERRLRTLVVNASLWLTHLLAVGVFLSTPRSRRLFLRHEDFLADPASATRRILEMAGCGAPPPDFTALRTGVPLLANKLVMSERVSLRDSAPPPPRRSLLTAVMQWPWRSVFARLSPRVEPEERAGPVRRAQGAS